jgi:hypothetical protein
MKTPFDGAIRVRRREIDDMRIAIGVQINQLVQVETAQAEIQAEMSHERDVAADDALLSSHAYMMRMRAERERLAENQAMIDARLAQLRAKAMAAYGPFKAITTAADTYRDEAAQAAANAEQSHLDDLSAANLVRGQLVLRRSGTR